MQKGNHYKVIMFFTKKDPQSLQYTYLLIYIINVLTKQLYYL